MPLRLAEQENLSQEEVGSMIGISRATVGRILAAACRKTASALVRGWVVRVEGGLFTATDDTGA